MKKTVSKIKNGSNKGPEHKNDVGKGVNAQSTTQDAQGTNAYSDNQPFTPERDVFYVYRSNEDSPRKIRGKTRNDFSIERSTTTYEAYTSSTSESEPERERDHNRNTLRQPSTKKRQRFRDGNNEVCITVPKRGKGNVRIVGNTNPGPSGLPDKQVDFSSFDAVYGTISEVSSDVEAYDVQANKKDLNVYRVEGQTNKVFNKDPDDNQGPSGLQYLAKNKEKNLANPEQVSTQNDFRSGKKQNTEAEQLVERPRAQPTLTLPVFSVTIQTSQEEFSREPSNGKNNTGTAKPSSQLFKLKKHILGIENCVGEQQKHTGVDIRTLENTDKQNKLRHGEPNGRNKRNINTNEIHFVNEKGTDTNDLRSALEQLMKASHQHNVACDPKFGQTSENTQSRNSKDNVESKNKRNEDDRLANSGIKRPLIYVATLDNNTVAAFGRSDKDEVTGKNKENNSLRTSSTASPKSVALNKSLSKQLSKKKSEVVGSKIGMKKSKRSFLGSYIPKAYSVCSRKRSSIVVSKINENVKGSLSKTSKKYAVRDIMVIPEEEAGQQFANVYPAQPPDHDISEELAEREIRLYDLNTDCDYETDQQCTSSSFDQGAASSKLKQKDLERNTSINLIKHKEGLSIPCLYYCSTSTVDTGDGTKNDNAVNSKVTNGDTQKPVTSNLSLIARKDNRQQESEIVGDRNVAPNYNEKGNTILIEPETHREIMKAIDASNGKARIISIPTQISLKDSTGKRLSLGAKRSKVNNPLRRSVKLVEAITEQDTQDEIKDNLHNKNVKSVKIASNEMAAITMNTETDRSELFEIRKKNDYQSPEEPEFNKSHPFTTENHHQNDTNITAFPSMVNNTTPMGYKRDKNFKNDQNSINVVKKRKKRLSKTKLLRLDQPRGSIGTVLSFSEPLILEECQNDFNVSEESPLNSNGRRAVGRRSKRKTNEPNFMTNTPDTMVYVGRLPNTTYNVFFSPDHTAHPLRAGSDGDENDVRNVQSDTKKLHPIKSEKLLTQGPKAILIFVNKKTELNRNPFDGNVVYDDDDALGKGRNNKGRGKSDKGKGKEIQKGGKHKGQYDNKSGRSRKSDPGSDFDHPGSHKSGKDGVVVEKSLSGLKTVVKYPCGCMKITKIDPENETVSEEITSAFCTLGSKCEISQSQKDKRLIRYPGNSSESGSSGYRQVPKSPQLDIVLEGIMSKKPIKPQPPAQKMRGANLTGTLTIKTNRCNGVFNFYIDPRVKQYIRNNLGCTANIRNSYSSRSYS